jgi:hypothetical protein
LKKSCAERPWQRPLAKTIFYFFLKKFFAERPVQLRLEKLGTPELENFSQSCRAYLPGALGK